MGFNVVFWMTGPGTTEGISFQSCIFKYFEVRGRMLRVWICECLSEFRLGVKHKLNGLGALFLGHIQKPWQSLTRRIGC